MKYLKFTAYTINFYIAEAQGRGKVKKKRRCLKVSATEIYKLDR